MAHFPNRAEAGRRLAELLAEHMLDRPIVLCLPRGGVPAGVEIARALGAPLDLAIAQKIGHPLNPEAAVGAVTEDGLLLLDDRIAPSLDPDWLRSESESQMREALRRREAYSGSEELPDLTGRTAILVDDGIATGMTMRAAVRSARNRGAARIMVAAPVAAKETVELLRREADEVVVAATPEPLFAVGAHYSDFRQVGDEEVLSALRDLGQAL
jgi:putative phosphoribosyl transferase